MVRSGSARVLFFLVRNTVPHTCIEVPKSVSQAMNQQLLLPVPPLPLRGCLTLQPLPTYRKRIVQFQTQIFPCQSKPGKHSYNVMRKVKVAVTLILLSVTPWMSIAMLLSEKLFCFLFFETCIMFTRTKVNK